MPLESGTTYSPTGQQVRTLKAPVTNNSAALAKALSRTVYEVLMARMADLEDKQNNQLPKGAGQRLTVE